MALLAATIDALLAADGAPVRIPAFSKIADDRAPRSAWRVVHAPPEVILLEGWCVGALVSPGFADGAPLNAVEVADADGAWRAFQARALAEHYVPLWRRFAAFLHVRAPSWEAVRTWRLEQEADLLGVEPADLPSARVDWVQRFTDHFERLTRAMDAGGHAPGRVVTLDARRRVVAVEG
jgi:D-glycerate 3-kinase